mmetsp:Transcript_17148/g.45389  ORF Transcript_17148/g.45389 Transcript_17148/m.45389 type:complete len:228 (-) Transcript_17148:77-760(-)
MPMFEPAPGSAQKSSAFSDELHTSTRPSAVTTVASLRYDPHSPRVRERYPMPLVALSSMPATPVWYTCPMGSARQPIGRARHALSHASSTSPISAPPATSAVRAAVLTVTVRMRLRSMTRHSSTTAWAECAPAERTHTSILCSAANLTAATTSSVVVQRISAAGSPIVSKFQTIWRAFAYALSSGPMTSHGTRLRSSLRFLMTLSGWRRASTVSASTASELRDEPIT